MISARLLATSLSLLILPLTPGIGAEEPATLHWYRCNTHTHTSARPNSDANGSPEFVAEWYRSRGYHCIVITDHEFLTDVASLNEKYARTGDFLVLPGQEITQIIDDPDPALPNGMRHTHVNGINTNRLILPVGHPGRARGLSATATYERNLAAVIDAGGIPQINHPNLQWSVGPEDLLPISKPFLLEIWNAFPTSNNLGGTDEAGRIGLSTEALWDALLTRGRRVWGVASDDAHEYRAFEDRATPTPGKAWIVLRAASLTVPAVMDALRRGQFYASTGISLEDYQVDEKQISLRIAPSREWVPTMKGNARVLTRFIGAGGRVLAEVAGLSPHYRFKGDESYVRASIIDSDGRRAWTQPVFRESASAGRISVFCTASESAVARASCP